MIQVQIASQVTLSGVVGIRWVLVAAADTAYLPVVTPAALLSAAQSAGAAADRAHRPSRALSLVWLKLLVMSLGVATALWLAQATLGPARWPWWRPAAAESAPRDRLPSHTVPGTAPASPPASAAVPLVSAVVA